jgi:hypothetical protein
MTAPCWDSSGRLWSLWEMLRFHAENFFRLSGALTWMLAVSTQRNGEVPKEQRERLLSDISQCGDQCLDMGLRVSALQAGRIGAECQQSNYTYEQMRNSVGDLQQRIHDELMTIWCIRVPADLVRYMREPQPFGAEIATAFPSTAYDIDEAAKCLALSRSTAVVFHLMRTMEAGLKGLAFALGIPYAPSWESYLTQIEKRIEEKHKNKTRKWKKNQAFFRDVMGDLQVVKMSWRNPTMHIVRTYTPEEAQQIFGAVKTFMGRLAANRISDATKKALV